ncbi:hypothetical protein PanWU01x14_341390, partial [Parasponia andersonii]
WTSGIRPVRLLLETLNSFKFEKSNRGISPPSSLFSARNTVRPEILDKSGNVPNNLLLETSSIFMLFNMAREGGRLPESRFPLTCKRVSCLQEKIWVEIPPLILLYSR